MNIKVLYRRSNCSVARAGNILILQWKGPSDVEGASAFREAVSDFLQQESGRFGFLTLVEPESVTTPPPQDVRAHVGLTLKASGDRVAASAVVYEQEGFKAAMVRTLIGTINLVSNTRFPTHVTSTLSEALQWLTQRMGPDADIPPEDLLGEIAELRQTAA